MSQLVIQIRGSNGAGKSSVMWGLLKRFPKLRFRHGDGTIWAYQLCCTPRLYILGRYEYPPAGGCDNIRTMQEITDGIEQLHQLGDNVIFEGASITGTSTLEMFTELEDTLPNTKFIHAYLDTPIEDCIAGILYRRKKAGIDKVLDPHKSVIPKFNSVKRTQQKLHAMGRDTRIISRATAVDQILQWLREPCIRRFPRVPPHSV